MDFDKFTKTLKQIQVSKANQLWLSKNKVKILAFARANRISQPMTNDQLPMTNLWRWLYRPALALAVVVLLILGVSRNDTATALAFKPTSPLYPIKLTAEKLEGLLIFDDAKKLDFVIRLAQKRMEELRQTLDEKGDQADSKVVNKVLAEYSQLMEQASQNIDKIVSKGDKRTLLSVGKKLQDSKPTAVTSKIKPSKENASAVLSAENAALNTEDKALEALKQIEEEQRVQARLDAENQINSLDKAVVELQNLMNQAKSQKGYVVLGNIYSKLEQTYSLLESARKNYQQGNYLAATDSANEGAKLALEVKKDLFGLLDLKLEEATSSATTLISN